MSYQYAQQIWDFLSSYIGNDYGVAGLMGNLEAESGLLPFRLQGDFTSDYAPSHEYTNNVDNGTYTKEQFRTDQKGYGLAQWTTVDRKTKMYTRVKETGHSIGDLNAQLNFLKWELENDFRSTLNTLKTATSIRQASDYVLHHFEAPLDQSEAVELERFNNSQAIYDTYSGSSPIPDPSPEPEPEPDPDPTPPEPQPDPVPAGLGTSSLIMACFVAIIKQLKRRR